MNFDLINHTVFLTRHGSQAYGLNTSASDLDVKGVCLPPSAVQHDLFHTFEQAENNEDLLKYLQGYDQSATTKLINPNNPKVESTVYSLRKFFVLAAGCNPNIIELLFVDPSDIIIHTDAWLYMQSISEQFLSKKAKFTFAGYAFAQLNRIKRHRRWMLNPVKELPSRKSFDLPDDPIRAYGELERAVKRQVEEWNLSTIPVDEQYRAELKERCWDFAKACSSVRIEWSNWPRIYWAAALSKIADKYNLAEDVVQYLGREHQYKMAVEDFKEYQNWVTKRNPERKVMEEKFTYDVKHGMHLVRLLHMGVEILETGKVRVKRPDREFLMDIRNGGWTYERLIEYSEGLQTKLDGLYETSKLPRSVDFEKLNEHYHHVYQTFVKS